MGFSLHTLRRVGGALVGLTRAGRSVAAGLLTLKDRKNCLARCEGDFLSKLKVGACTVRNVMLLFYICVHIVISVFILKNRSGFLELVKIEGNDWRKHPRAVHDCQEL